MVVAQFVELDTPEGKRRGHQRMLEESLVRLLAILQARRRVTYAGQTAT